MTTESTADRLTVAWVGDLPRIRAFLDAHGALYDLTEQGRGRDYKIIIHQKTPKLTGNRVTARVGDALVFRSALLEVDKRKPKKRLPPPGAAREPLRRPSRTRNGALT